jgi:clan AA aspartic protease
MTLRIEWEAMAREDGSINARREPWLRVRTTAGETLDCLIDTGFDGALVLPRPEATRLNLIVLGRVPIIGVGRIRAIADIAELEVEWLGESRAVEVIISSGDDSLLGTELLDGSRLVIDFINYTVTVSDEA